MHTSFLVPCYLSFLSIVCVAIAFGKLLIRKFIKKLIVQAVFLKVVAVIYHQEFDFQ